ADSGVQYEQDPLQGQTIIERLPARITEAALLPRQQRLDPLPQRIGDLPRLRSHRHPPPTLTTGADGLRYRPTGPFIQLEVLKPKSDAGGGRNVIQSGAAASRFAAAVADGEWT